MDSQTEILNTNLKEQNSTQDLEAQTHAEQLKLEKTVEDLCSSQDLEEILTKIPDQMAFKIGDVAQIADVKPYVLRYWEQEFSVLKPKKAVNNQRIYSRRDVETVLMIKKFLYVDKFSIPGAIRAIKLARKKQAQGDETKSETKLNMSQLKEVEKQMDELISKVRSIKGKMIHKFFQIGL